MKSLVVSLLLFVTIVVAVILNAFYVHTLTEYMKEQASSACQSENAEAELEALIEYWNRHRVIVGLSASFDKIDSITEQLLSMRSAIKSDNRSILLQSYELFCNALDDVDRYEKLSADTLF